MPLLPTTVRTILGEAVDLTAERWRLSRDRRMAADLQIPVFRLDHPHVRGQEGRPSKANRGQSRSSMLHPDVTHAMRMFLAYRLTRRAPNSVRASLSAYAHFERYCYDSLRFRRRGEPITAAELNADLVNAYRDHCEQALTTKGKYPWELVLFYRWCRQQGFPGFVRAVELELRGISFEAGLRGHIARMQCPRRGPFEFEERAQIDEAIRDGRGGQHERAIVFLFQQLGLRTNEAVLLRRRHLEPPLHAGEHWWLQVPISKRRGSAGREVTVRRRINPQLGEALLALPVPAGEDPPLLDLPLRSASDAIRGAMRRWAEDVDLVTDRVAAGKRGSRSTAGHAGPANDESGTNGVRLPLFPYRFRRTIALLLANEGAEAGTIAAALGDRTLAMASVYAQSSSSMVEILERTLDRHPDWIRVVKMFRGELAQESHRSLPVILGGVPQLAQYAEYVDIGTIGFCSNAGECTLYPPLSCYRCPFFRALPSELPHRRQLAQLKEEIADGVGVESDRMVAVLERDAAAIVEVLARATERAGPIGSAINRIRGTRTLAAADLTSGGGA